MKVLAVIPARYNSSRFPGKPLAEIFGKPMLQWVYNNSSKSTLIDKVVIATDDDRIKSSAEGFSAEVIMTSSDHQSGTDRCAEVLELLNRNNEHFDLVINIQGDEPFINFRSIDKLIESMKKSAHGIGTLGKPFLRESILDNPNRVKIRREEDGAYFFRELVGDEDYLLPGLLHIGMYAYRAEVLEEISQLSMTSNEKEHRLEQLRWIDNGYSIDLAIVDSESPSVDSPEDLEKIIEKGESYWC